MRVPISELNNYTPCWIRDGYITETFTKDNIPGVTYIKYIDGSIRLGWDGLTFVDVADPNPKSVRDRFWALFE